MNSNRAFWFGRYEGWLRLLAHGVKDGDADCIRKAARLFDLMLPDVCVVIPMPSHNGRAEKMMDVAKAIPGRGRFRVAALFSEPHERSYDVKKDGLVPAPFKTWCDPALLRAAPEDAVRGGLFVIDNVLCTGATAGSALAAMDRAGRGPARVCALAACSWR